MKQTNHGHNIHIGSTMNQRTTTNNKKKKKKRKESNRETSGGLNNLNKSLNSFPFFFFFVFLQQPLLPLNKSKLSHFHPPLPNTWHFPFSCKLKPTFVSPKSSFALLFFLLPKGPLCKPPLLKQKLKQKALSSLFLLPSPFFPFERPTPRKTKTLLSF